MYNAGRQFIGLWLLLCLAAVAGLGQQSPPEMPAPKAGGIKSKPGMPFPRPGRVDPPNPGETSEKSIAIDPNAAIQLCVLDGRLRVNGWNRSEMRVFVREGSHINVRVLEKSADSDKPVWVLIASEGKPGAGPECLSGDLIEIDAPTGASFIVKGRTTQMRFDTIKKVEAYNVEGSIALRNIPGGITASNSQGGVTVENSGGSISLESSTGNIVAYEVTPGKVGDVFKAKTNSGAISLQRVEHRQIEARSVTGSLLFDGKFLTGGLYNFRTSNGAIRLMIPHDSSCTIKAAYGFGLFNSELPMEVLTETVAQGGKSLVAKMASGNATVNLTTSSGSIGIRKQ
jgi:hypothetical protein